MVPSLGLSNLLQTKLFYRDCDDEDDHDEEDDKEDEDEEDDEEDEESKPQLSCSLKPPPAFCSQRKALGNSGTCNHS